MIIIDLGMLDKIFCFALCDRIGTQDIYNTVLRDWTRVSTISFSSRLTDIFFPPRSSQEGNRSRVFLRHRDSTIHNHADMNRLVVYWKCCFSITSDGKMDYNTMSGCWSLYVTQIVYQFTLIKVRWSWRPNRRWNIFTPVKLDVIYRSINL